MAEAAWWCDAVLYQIYPRSFQDSDGDGVGDLVGIRERLGYLESLGVDALWLSPFYRSPMADFGYDVSDHCDIDPLFGSLADFDALLAACHERGLKLLIDLVPNHTSVAHPWFEDSRASRSAEKRDWYIWRDPAPDGGPPNNWTSEFGGSAWQWDARTGQYYYHAYLPEQPDLNWRNPAVRRAVFDIMRFWLDRGVDGFRIDVVWHLAKDPRFRDNPVERDPASGRERQVRLYNTDRPDVFDYIAEMCEVTGAYEGRVLIGEIYLPVDRLVDYFVRKGGCEHLPFNFHLVLKPWKAQAIGTSIEEFESRRPADGTPVWALGNHDVARVASRIGGDQARVAAMLLLTLPGMPTVYYGDELGMRDAEVSDANSQDPLAQRIAGRGRDGPRAPMAWSRRAEWGFTEGRPWLDFAANAEEANLAAQRRDPCSMLALYTALIALRKSSAALRRGEWRLLQAGDGVLAYELSLQGERLLVALNFSNSERTLKTQARQADLLLSTCLDRPSPAQEDGVRLRGNEGRVLSLGAA
ncbi:MAG: alpha-amylase family glycosyl hydrolase [Rhodovibrionaceae bacterium]|nr:alpha-amylase family glycosyl hydrolase [Rhodovibrionaceae bacterium]